MLNKANKAKYKAIKVNNKNQDNTAQGKWYLNILTLL